MSERIVNDPSQHGWVEDNGKWVWGASGGTGAGMVISESEPADKVEGMQWLNPTTGLVLFWDDEKWLQMPGGKDGAPGADGNIQDATEDGVIATWDDTNKQWTPESALTIDATGNVGIGGTPVSSSRRLMIKDVNDVRVDLRSGTDNDLGAIDFSDTSNNARGQIVYDHATDGMTFKTLSADRLTIDSTGNATFSGTVTVNGNRPVISTRDLIETLHTLREATKDESTLEGLRDAIGNAVGELIDKFEAMQAEADNE